MNRFNSDVKKRTLLLGAACGLVLALAGCATTSAPAKETKPVAPAAMHAPAKPAAAAPAAPAVAAAPGSGMGTIVFFREKKFAGAAVSFKVREGEQELGKLSSGTYFIVQVKPGAHTYVVHSEAKDVFNLEVEPGETYYVRGSISMGVMVGHPNLSPSDATTFNGMKDKLKNSAEKT
jgi:uncharacterized protein DUF2846